MYKYPNDFESEHQQQSVHEILLKRETRDTENSFPLLTGVIIGFDNFRIQHFFDHI